MTSKDIVIAYLRDPGNKDPSDVAFACNDLQREVLTCIFKTGTIDSRVAKTILTVAPPDARSAASYLEKNLILPAWILSLIYFILQQLIGQFNNPKVIDVNLKHELNLGHKN